MTIILIIDDGLRLNEKIENHLLSMKTFAVTIYGIRLNVGFDSDTNLDYPNEPIKVVESPGSINFSLDQYPIIAFNSRYSQDAYLYGSFVIIREIRRECDEGGTLKPIIISDTEKSELARLTQILEDRNNSVDDGDESGRIKYDFEPGLFVFPLMTADYEDGYDSTLGY